MRFRPYRNSIVRAFGSFFAAVALGIAGSDAIAEAVALLQAGDAEHAEQVLRDDLRVQPNDGEALGLLGVVLDQQKKYQEADPVYRRALALEPQAPRLRNNYGNHLVASNRFKQAEDEFLHVIAVDPSNTNARMQLARLALREKLPAKAVANLNGLPASIRERPDAMLLRMQAEYQMGHKAAADRILELLSGEAEHGLDATLAIGTALFGAEQYEQAEKLFARGMDLAPGSFDAVYDCGLAASRAGHNERARELLDQASRQQPTNVDVIYDLAVVNAKLGNHDAAVGLLGRASRLAPTRPDLQQLLARITAELGYFADSAVAWDKYLQLVPGDDSARRERAFVQTAISDQAVAGLNALAAYVRRHPTDPVGHYELGTAESPSDADSAFREFNRAITLNPEFAAARFARGLLLYRQGNPEAALLDFEWTAKHVSKNAAVLDRLGETQLALNQVEKAVDTLRAAVELAPGNVTILNHLGRALTKLGQREEAQAVFARLRELGPARSESPHPAGLLDFLSLSPEEQLARYRAGVERVIEKNPDNVQAQLQYLQLLLEDGNTEQALSVTRKIALLKPAPTLARETEAVLLSAQQYDAVKQFRADLSRSNSK
jgi:Flp pilus assembly protein TadD